MKDIHNTIADIFWNRIANNITRDLGVQTRESFPESWEDKRLKLLKLWERARWHELSLEDLENIDDVINSNRIQALVSPVKWIREWKNIS